jgi:hypothetical protein
VPNSSSLRPIFSALSRHFKQDYILGFEFPSKFQVLPVDPKNPPSAEKEKAFVIKSKLRRIIAVLRLERQMPKETQITNNLGTIDSPKF